MRANWKTIILLLAIIATYCYRLGSASFNAAEAYSIYAASQKGPSEVANAALLFDLGKPPLYQLALHYFLKFIECSEESARLFSVLAMIFCLIGLYILTKTLFDSDTALLATALFGFNPFIIMVAQWTRMYALLAALSVLTILALDRARRRGSLFILALFSLSLTATLYTHMEGLLLLIVVLIIIFGDLRHESTNRFKELLSAIAALFAFLPFLRLEVEQGKSLFLGHWLDWADKPFSHLSILIWAAIVLLASIALVRLGWMSLNTPLLDGFGVCVIWAVLPLVIVISISLIGRPIIAWRYFILSLPPATILVAVGLWSLSPFLRTMLCLTIFCLFLIIFLAYQTGRREPWRLIALAIYQEHGQDQPMFFESGSIVQTPGKGDDGFQQGYFRIPFDLYFHGPAPRIAFDPAEPWQARKLIERAAVRDGGAWLLSSKPSAKALAELPDNPGFRIRLVLEDRLATLYRIEPLSQGAGVRSPQASP